jgi:site-specific DNA-methyltransferase (adenine-specific)
MNLPIKDIKTNPKNPRIIKDDKFKKLVQSLKDFPEMADVREIVVNKDHIVLGGNMRLKAMQEAGWKEAPVKVVDWSQDKQDEFVVKDNASFGEWDWDELGNQYEAAELIEWGLDLPNGLGDEEVEEDEAPEVSQEEPKSKLGEIYKLGRHRVMSGDSIDNEQVKRLMNGDTPELLFTDPPYRMEAEGGSNQWVGKQARKLGETIKDIVDFEPEPFLSVIADIFKPKMNAYIFCNKDLVPDYLLWARDNKFGFNILVWKKPNALPLGGSHRPDLEYIIKVHKSAVWNNGISDVNYSKCLEYSRDNSENHPTIKPLGLIVNELKISSTRQGIVLDLYLGSGSTLIACEQTDRTCYGMELDPKYVDVIRKRYHKFITGEVDGWELATPAIM